MKNWISTESVTLIILTGTAAWHGRATDMAIFISALCIVWAIQGKRT